MRDTSNSHTKAALSCVSGAGTRKMNVRVCLKLLIQVVHTRMSRRAVCVSTTLPGCNGRIKTLKYVIFRTVFSQFSAILPLYQVYHMATDWLCDENKRGSDVVVVVFCFCFFFVCESVLINGKVSLNNTKYPAYVSYCFEIAYD